MALQEGLFVDAEEFALDGAGMARTVDSLTYVMHADDETGLVGLYARQLEARVQALETVMRCIDPNMRELRARLRN